MKQFTFVYYGEPEFASREDGAAHMSKWMAWVGGLGDAMVNPGLPVGKPVTVSATGVSDGSATNRLVGFSVVEADSIEAAVEMAKKCPHLDHGTIDVAEAMDMKMG
jgi:hypothetical protein